MKKLLSPLLLLCALLLSPNASFGKHLNQQQQPPTKSPGAELMLPPASAQSEHERNTPEQKPNVCERA
jgi:hypothetical protein